MPEGRGTVPEGRSDRSLARSAWNSPTHKNRPVGHGMIGRRPNPRGISSKGAPCFLRKANHSNRRIGAHTGANQTVPYGTALFEVAPSQALRARLRSDRPSGTGGKAPSASGQQIVSNIPLT